MVRCSISGASVLVSAPASALYRFESTKIQSFSNEFRKRSFPMAHVVTEPCILCKYTDCVDVCPVDCFREGPNFLVIDPDECIDCAVCIPECPTNAIMAEEDVPEDQQEFIALNAELARVWPSITRMKPHTDEAEKWRDVLDKRQYLKKEL